MMDNWVKIPTEGLYAVVFFFFHIPMNIYCSTQFSVKSEIEPKYQNRLKIKSLVYRCFARSGQNFILWTFEYGLYQKNSSSIIYISIKFF